MEEVTEIDEKYTDTEEKYILSLSYDLSDSDELCILPATKKVMFIVMESQLSIYMYASLWGDIKIQ